MVQEKNRLTEKVEEMIERQKQLEEVVMPKKKEKKYRLPIKGLKGFKRKVKKGKCLILWIKTNGLIKPAWESIEDEQVLFKENKTMHLANSASLLSLNGKVPTLIIPEGSMLPYNPRTMEKMINKKGLSAIAQKIIINNIEKVQADVLKKKFAGKWLLIIGAVIVVGYIVMQLL